MTRRERIEIARVYEHRSSARGRRVLVDRLWPRGLAKVDAHFDQWRKDLSPSTELRQFYGHRPERFAEFKKRYRAELRHKEAAAAVSELVDLTRRRAVTLLTASRDASHSEAAVLAAHVRAIGTRRARRSDASTPRSRSTATR
jgi:uncharacterized protein YeaO (DUF488 family)